MSRFCEVELSGELLHEKNEGSKVASSKIKVKAEMKFADFIKLGIEWLKEKTSPEKVGVKSKKYLNDNCNYSACAPASAQIGSTVDYAKISSSGCSTQIGSSGDRAQIGSSGYLVKIGSSGYSAKIGSSGDSAQIASSGSHVQIGSVGDFAKINTSGYSTQINSTGEESVIMCAGRDSVVKTKKGSWITLAEWYIDEETEKMRPKCVKTEYVDGERIKEDTWYKLVDGEFVSLDTLED